MEATHLASLAAFRAAAYTACGRRGDALFELCDTLLTTGPVSSLPLLSVQPQHQHGWGSLSDALAVREIRATCLESLLTQRPLAGGEPLYAVDVSVWPRCDAETSPGRALYYHSSRHSAGQPIVAGRGVFLDRAGRLCAGELDGASPCAAAVSPRERQCCRRRADRGPCPAAAC
jgi:DDE superfamily endonuclease